MVLKRTDLHKFVPVTATGEVLGTAFEVDTETKVAKCRGVLTVDQRMDLMRTIPGCPEHPRMLAGHDFSKTYFSQMWDLERQQPSYEKTFDHLEPIEEIFPWRPVGGPSDPGYDALYAIDPDGNRHCEVISLDPATKTGMKEDPFKDYKTPTTVEEGFILDQQVRDLKPVPFKYDHLARLARGSPTMTLTIKDLVEQGLIPVDEYGDEIGVAYEVDTDTKVAKCLAILLRDHSEPSQVLNPINERHGSCVGPAPEYTLNPEWHADFQATVARWQGDNLPTFYRFEKLVPHEYQVEDGWWGSRYDAIKEREAKNNLPVVVREYPGFHNPKTAIESGVDGG